jgi:Fur family transcriptional regulator, ferric uptake regulator
MPQRSERHLTADGSASWREFVKARGLKLTGQRQAVVEAFCEIEGHVSLDELVSIVRKRAPAIGMATIYRTMKLLEEAGLAERHDFQDGASRYEPTAGRKHHDHLICRGCGFIREFESEALEALQTEIARSFGFSITAHQHVMYGLCRDCQPAHSVVRKESP